MTEIGPDDVAAIRADAYREPSLEAHRIRALCDALAAAWAERDRERDRHANSVRDALAEVALVEAQREELRERAERAERWRDNALDQLSMTLAALARVRDLADNCARATAAEILAAIEGESVPEPLWRKDDVVFFDSRAWTVHNDPEQPRMLVARTSVGANNTLTKLIPSSAVLLARGGELVRGETTGG